jgi:hypothetical protein
MTLAQARSHRHTWKGALKSPAKTEGRGFKEEGRDSSMLHTFERYRI